MSSRLENTREGLLDAAWELVIDRGAEVSMAEIAKAVGVSRQAVYLHFGSRAGLLDALVKRADERFGIFANFEQALAESDPEQRLQRCLSVWFEFVLEISPVALDLIRLRTTDAAASKAWEDRMVDARALFAQLIYSLAEDKVLSDGMVKQDAAEYLWAACSVQSWNLLTGDCAWPVNKAQTHLIQAAKAALLRG